ncbi:hypothetical protein [Streptomyces spinosus]|uniref:hypothetical protein n=1 Tax=Streptomyces spinosus TaxID=2872623 RepID=UPI001CEDCA06|nr:hypothetical protein [Streptomyces spinosus]
MALGTWRPGAVVLEPYEALDDVCGGGTGAVQRVRHRGRNVDLAVRTPRPDLVASEAGRHRFEAEAGTWVGPAPVWVCGLHPHRTPAYCSPEQARAAAGADSVCCWELDRDHSW